MRFKQDNKTRQDETCNLRRQTTEEKRRLTMRYSVVIPAGNSSYYIHRYHITIVLVTDLADYR